MDKRHIRKVLNLVARIARTVAARWALHRLERQQPTLENIFLSYIAHGEKEVQDGPEREAA